MVAAISYQDRSSTISPRLIRRSKHDHFRIDPQRGSASADPSHTSLDSNRHRNTGSSRHNCRGSRGERFVVWELYQGEWKRAFRSYRANLGRGILLGLEFLIAADVIGMVAIVPTFERLGILGLIYCDPHVPELLAPDRN